MARKNTIYREQGFIYLIFLGLTYTFLIRSQGSCLLLWIVETIYLSSRHSWILHEQLSWAIEMMTYLISRCKIKLLPVNSTLQCNERDGDNKRKKKRSRAWFLMSIISWKNTSNYGDQNDTSNCYRPTNPFLVYIYWTVMFA